MKNHLLPSIINEVTAELYMKIEKSANKGAFYQLLSQNSNKEKQN